MVRDWILALLAERPLCGMELKARFETGTSGTWLVNAGQVYSTLGRLERSGLVARLEADDNRRVRYSLTTAGRVEVERWWQTPANRNRIQQSELVIKLALAIASPGAKPATVIQTQRAETMRRIEELTIEKELASPDENLSRLMILDHQLLLYEAEVRWLNHVDSVTAQARRPRG